MSNAIELYVFDADGDALIAAADAESDYDAESCALVLRTDQGPRLGEDFNLGRADLLAPQLREAARRLDAGAPALVRAAILDEAVVPYVRFEIDGERVWVSAFTIDDPAMQRAWPIPAEVWQGGRVAAPGPTPEDLDAWVAAKGAALYDHALSLRAVKASDLRWSAPRGAVVAGLAAAAAAAESLSE